MRRWRGATLQPLLPTPPRRPRQRPAREQVAARRRPGAVVGRTRPGAGAHGGALGGRGLAGPPRPARQRGQDLHLPRLLAEQSHRLGSGHTLVRREYPTAIGPVDILARDAAGATVAVELKRRGDIDGVEQLTRYLELLNRDPLLAPVRGVYAAQLIRPQARVLAEDRGIACLTLDYDEMRGLDDSGSRLF